jgi:hypothetical protein
MLDPIVDLAASGLGSVTSVGPGVAAAFVQPMS